MIDILQVASDVATHAVEAGHHAAASSNPVEKLAQGFHVQVETLVAQIVSILIVLTALRFFAWNPILKILDERRQKIDDGLQYGEEAKNKLADAERREDEILKEAALEAKKIQTEAQQNAKVFTEKAHSEALKKAEELIAQTRESLELERKQMITEVKEHASKLVATTAAKVLKKELSQTEKTRLIDSAASELKS